MAKLNLNIMHESTNRRDFIKTASVLGTSLLAAQAGLSAQTNVAPAILRTGATKSKINLGIS